MKPHHAGSTFEPSKPSKPDNRSTGQTCEIVDFIYMLNGQTSGMFSTPEEFAKKTPIKTLIQFREEPQVMSHDSYPECEPCDVRDDKLLYCV